LTTTSSSAGSSCARPATSTDHPVRPFRMRRRWWWCLASRSVMKMNKGIMNLFSKGMGVR
jgi:hypothetical protein